MELIKTTISVGISSRPLSIESALKRVRSRKAGGTAVFIGSVRDTSGSRRVTRMEMETARDLALADLRRIAGLASKAFKTTHISVVHRVGKLKVGDTIVVIAVSAPHRKEAFAACRFVIDELKKSTPLWKKEYHGRSGLWVD